MKNTFLRTTQVVYALLFCGLFVPVFLSAQIVAAPTDKQVEALDAFMAPYRQKVVKILEADKTGQYQTYLADLAALGQATDAAKEEKLAAALTRNHYAFIKKAYTQAVINHEEMKKGVAKILGNDKFTLDEFGGISGTSFQPLAPLPLKFDAELTAPYEASQADENVTVVGVACKAEVSTTTTKLTSAALYDGGCRSKGSLGDKFDLPTGTFQKITVSAQVDFEYFGRALSLGGYAKVNTKIGVRLIGPGLDKVVVLKERWAVSPVIWYTQYKESINNFMAQNTFTGTFNGGNTYTAQAYSESFAVAISPLTSSSRAECEIYAIDFIKVSAKE